jgi:glyoxylase-like metal-dependent hydrolase (beta-lactamase superfamily II)
MGARVTAPLEHFTLEELSPGIHVAIATPEGYGLCNAAIVDLGGSTLVFDAMLTPQAGESLRRAAERLTGRPIDFVVNSHYHGDHVRGNTVLGALHVVSTRRVRELVLERATSALASDRAEVPGELERLRTGALPATPADRRVLEGWYGGILATPADYRVRPPDLTFEEELVLHGARRSARIVTFGGGHSPSDVLVHLPEERLVLLGDLLSSGFHPSLWDGDPVELYRILDRVLELRIDRALPGHGPVSDAAGIRTMQQYVRVLQELARTRHEGKVPPDRTEGVRPPPPFDDWVFSSFFAQNLEFVQRRSHDPH